MNTTAFGFRQDLAKEHGVKLTELLFLDWFAYWYGSDKMCTVIHDGKLYGWVDRKYVIRQLPLLEINHVDSVTRLITRMIDKGLLERHVRANEDNRGHRMFIKPGPLMHTLRGGDDVDNCDPPPREGEESDDQPTEESVSQPDQPTVESAKTPGPADPNVSSYTNPRDNTNPKRDTNMSATALEPSPPVVVSQPPKEEILRRRELVPLKDTDAAMWEDALTAIQPADTWGDFGKERRHCGNLAKRSRGMLSQSPYETMRDLIEAVIEEFRKLQRNAKQNDVYWSNAPYTPSAFMTRWPQIWHGLAKEHERNVRTQRDAEMYSRLPW